MVLIYSRIDRMWKLSALIFFVFLITRFLCSDILKTTALRKITSWNFPVTCGNGASCLGNQKQCPLRCGSAAETGHVNPSIIPIGRFNNTTLSFCFKHCINTFGCRMVAFNTSQNTCNLYNTSSFKPEFSDIKCFIFECCNLDKCQIPAYKNRCPGKWIDYVDTIVNITNRPPISSHSNTQSMEDCRNLCLKISVCGSVNYNPYSALCELIFWWVQPINQNFNVISKVNSTNSKWTCCKNEIEPDSQCRPHVNGGCNGKWQVSNSSVPPSSSDKVVTMFYTADAQQCRSECAYQANCLQVWYNQTEGLCALEANDSQTGCSIRYYSFPKIKLKAWKWVCCIQPSRQVNSRIKIRSSNCVRINDAANVTLVEDNCKYPDTKSGLKVYSGMIFTSLTHQETIEGKVWQYAFNGFKHFWYSQNVGEAITNCPHEQCKIYSGKTKPGFPTIVSRQQWYSLPFPKNKTSDKTPRRKVVEVIASKAPNCSCYTRDSCAWFIESYQAYQEKYYKCSCFSANFAIGNDGSIYEMAGWDLLPGLPPNFDPKKIIIIFIGNFSHFIPTISALTAAKQLINIGEKRESISDKYHLQTIENEWNKGLIPILANWKGFNGAKSDRYCPPNYLRMYLISSICGAVLISCIIILVVFLVKSNRLLLHRSLCRRLHQNANLNIDRPIHLRSSITVNLEYVSLLSTLNLDGFTIHGIDIVSNRNSRCRCHHHLVSITSYTQNDAISNVINKLERNTFLENCPDNCQTGMVSIISRNRSNNVLCILFHLKDIHDIELFYHFLAYDVCICTNTYQLTSISREVNLSINESAEGNIFNAYHLRRVRMERIRTVNGAYVNIDDWMIDEIPRISQKR